MAAKNSTQAVTVRKKVKKKRPGVHSKKKVSKSKNAKNYKKTYKGQGR